MTAINSAALLAMAREGYCMHQISSVSGVKLETVRGILRAANQNGEYDAALHLSPTKRQVFHNPGILASRAYMYPQVPPMDYGKLEERVLAFMAAAKMAANNTKAENWGNTETKAVKPKLTPREYLKVAQDTAAVLAAKKMLEKTKETVDSINPLTYVQHLEDEDLMYLLQVGMNELQKRYYGKDEASS